MDTPISEQDASRQSPFFRVWATVVVRYRWLFLFASLAATGFMAFEVFTELRIENTVEAFLASDSEPVLVLEDLRDNFGQDTYFQVLVAGDVFTLPYLERLKALHRELADLRMDIESLGERKRDREERNAREREPGGGTADGDAVGFGEARGESGPGDGFQEFAGDEGWGEEGGGSIVEEVTSLVNARQTAWSGGGLRVFGLLDDWPVEEELSALRKRVLSDRTLVGQVVGEKGRHSVIVLRTDFMSEEDSSLVTEELERIARGHQAPGFRVRVAGQPALGAAIRGLMVQDLRQLIRVSLLVITLIVAVLFRHPLGIIGPVLVVVQSAFWTLGAMALTGQPMTVITNVLPAFLACVGVGDSIHIQSVYRDARARGVANREAIVHAVASTGPPVLFTSLTTAAGLLSFRFASLQAIVNVGTFGAFGVCVALLYSLLFLPIVLTFNRKSLLGLRAGARKADRLDRFLDFCNDLSRDAVPARKKVSRRRLTVMVSALLGLLGMVGALMLTVRHDPLTWLPAESEIRKTYREMDAHVGGTANVILLIEARPGKTVKNRDLLLSLEGFERRIRSYRFPGMEGHIVGNTTSVLDVVRESWRALNGGSDAFYALPDSQRGVVDMFTLFENASPDELKRLVTIDMARAVMNIRVKWLDAWSYKPLTEYIRGEIEKTVGNKAEIKLTGSVFAFFSVVAALLKDLLRSFSTAFVAITIMMILLLRQLKLGLISMIPNLLPIVMVMGFMGFSSISIDVSNMLIASIAIGIAVDDTIHFLHQFRIHYQANGDVEAAIDHTFSHTGRAITMTSLILVAGFCVFLAAGMSNIQRFGILVSLTIVLALFIDLIFAPALLRTFYATKGRD